jgi:hypothetical protein
VTPDYWGIVLLIGLALSAWWLSEKLQQLREERNRQRLAPKLWDIRGETVAERKKRSWR